MKSTPQAIIERLLLLDTNADELFPRFVAAVGIQIDRESGDYVRDKAGELFLAFGVHDLAERLERQGAQERRAGTPQDDIARARIWRHVAEASKPLATKSSEGSISDITELSQLNPWLVKGKQVEGRGMPARRCESCGMFWDCVVHHFSKTGAQQTDATRAWFCLPCFRQPAIRKHHKIELPMPTNPPCAVCAEIWEAVPGLGGGHVSVKGESEAWVCHNCARANPGTVVGSSVVLGDPPRVSASAEKKIRLFLCAFRGCAKGDKRTRGRVTKKGTGCSKECRRQISAVAKRNLGGNMAATLQVGHFAPVSMRVPESDFIESGNTSLR